jgi:dihydrofolate reductase
MPRKIIGSAFVSLDGVIQAPGGPTEDPTGGFAHGGWLPPFFDEITGQAMGDFFARDYDLLLGRRTYEIFAAYWPYVEGEDAGLGAAFNAANKYVLTHGDAALEWENSHRLGGMEDVAQLKGGDGPDLLIQGSGTIYPALLSAGLLDRLTLLTFPVILGAGKRLFGEGTPPRTMRMVDQKVSASGAVIATYEPAGDVGTGWAGPQVDSARERERQQRMEQGSW